MGMGSEGRRKGKGMAREEKGGEGCPQLRSMDLQVEEGKEGETGEESTRHFFFNFKHWLVSESY